MTTRRHRIPAAAAVLLVLAGVSPLGGAGGSRRPRKSPHVEIAAVARVHSAPRRTTHANRRQFEEFDVVILSSQTTSDQPPGSDARIVVARDRSVHVVHDLSCGGTWLDLAPGDEVEIQGEYVQPPNGKDLIHFTHPSGGACGRGESHPGGYLRKRERAA